MIDIKNLSDKTAKLYQLLLSTGLTEEKSYEALTKLEGSMYRSIVEDVLGQVTGEKLNALDKMYKDEAKEEQIAAFLNITDEELKRRMEEKLDLYCKNLTAALPSFKTKAPPTP